MFSRPLLGVLLIGVFSVPITAQSSAGVEPAKADDPKAVREGAKKQALTLTEETIRQTQTLKLPLNKIRIQLIALEIFWPRDEKRARALINDITNNFREAVSELDVTNQKSSDAYFPQRVDFFLQVRGECFTAIADRDPQLGLEFLRKTRPWLPPARNLYGHGGEYDLGLEMQLATRLATRNADEALRIARGSLERGFSYEVLEFLERLRTSKPEVAVSFASELLKRIYAANLAADNAALYVAVNWWSRASHPAQTQPDPDSSQPPVRVLDERALKDLLNRIMAVLTNRNDGESRIWLEYRRAFLTTLYQALPVIEKLAPEQASAVRKQFEKLSEFDANVKTSQQYQHLLANGTLEDILEAGKNAPPEMADNYYSEAVTRAKNHGDWERARQIINDNIRSPYRRKDLLYGLNQQVAYQAINHDKEEEARQFFSQFPLPEDRAYMLMQLAKNRLNKNDREGAAQRLDEARALLSDKPKDYGRLYVLLQLALVYSDVDTNRCFEVLEPLIERLNEIAIAIASIDGFEYSHCFKESEFVLQSNCPLTNAFYQQAEGVARLSNKSLARARNAVGKYQRDEMRLLAQILLARAIVRADGEDSGTPQK